MNQIINMSDVVEVLKRKSCPPDPSRADNILYLQKPIVTMRDGRYALYENGIVCDCYSGLEWLCSPDNDTNWVDAEEWSKSLTVAGGRWCLPGIEELSGLYKKNKAADLLTPLFKREPGDVWSKESVGESEALGFNFVPGNQFRTYKTISRQFRAMAVRPRQHYRGARALRILSQRKEITTA